MPSDTAVLSGNDAFLILVLPTEKWYSSDSYKTRHHPKPAKTSQNYTQAVKTSQKLPQSAKTTHNQPKPAKILYKFLA